MDSSKGYEFLDHTADVQIHSWGQTLKESFEQAALGMSGYMTDLSIIHPLSSATISAQGMDLIDLFFHFLDEVLFLYAGPQNLVLCQVNIISLDLDNFTIEAQCIGEKWQTEKHSRGTEIKAITFSNMQVIDDENHNDCYFIVDI